MARKWVVKYGRHKENRTIGGDAICMAKTMPKALDTTVFDEVIAIDNEDAFKEGREFALSEGIIVGISSGAALKAATILANRPENKGKNIVVLLPDSGDRHLSTPMFS